MPRTIRTLEDLTRPELEELEAMPAYKARWLTINIVTAAQLMAALAMGVVTALGVIPRPDTGGDDAQMIWPVLAILALLELPAMGFIAGRILRQAAAQKRSAAVAARGFTAIVICLAFSVAIVIYGMIGNALAMPKAAQYGLVAFGLAVLVGSQVWVRGRIRPLMLIALARETRAKDG